MPPNNQRDKDTIMTTKNQETPKTPVTKALPSSAGSIPLLEMATNPQNGYGLMNWNQVDQWGYANHPTWHQVHKMALYRGLDEVTKLRVLSDALMRQNVELQERCEEMMARLPPPPNSIQSNVERSRCEPDESNSTLARELAFTRLTGYERGTDK